MAAKKGPVKKAVEAAKGAVEAAKGAVKTADKKVVKPVAKAVGLDAGKKAASKKK
jgi:hypothetical protein